MQPTFMNIPENLCKCGHSLIAHNIPYAEGAPLLCDQCDCGNFYTENGNLRICDFPLLMELPLGQAGVVYINGVAFSVDAFEYFANPSPNICVIERESGVTLIRALPELHDALIEMARDDYDSWTHSHIESAIREHAQTLKPAKQIDDYIKIEGEQ